MTSRLNVVKNIYVVILLIIFGGIVLHAPLSVGLGVLFPKYDLLIKSWKEILMLIDGFVALFLLYKTNQFKILKSPIMMTIGAYAALHLVLTIYQFNNLGSSVAGLMIDLRYVLYFSLVYIATSMYPECKKIFVKVGLVGALVVMIFALLQVFVLPADILKYIGYGDNTIAPFMTVDQNHDFIRINSTLRGPNPLGAYAGMVLVLVVAAIEKHKIKNNKKSLVIASILLAGSAIALWCSYSRSALLVAVLSIIVLSIFVYRDKLSKKIFAVGLIILAIIMSGLFVFGGNKLISNVFLHDNPGGGSVVSSNDDHVSSLQQGLDQLVHQPLGAGVGSTGSASLMGSKPEIIENQYLFIAHEVGWLGLIYFIAIFGMVIVNLYRQSQDWLALGVLMSGIGLALIGLVLPVWVDDTVSIIWWGMAAIVVAPKFKKLTL